MSKREKLALSGWLVIDKPEGIGSTKVVGAVKRITRAAKVGHAGTLDPFASGILPIALGEATKTIQFATDAIKTYLFTLKFGERTATDDREGEVVERTDVIPAKEQIEAILPRFTGDVTQIPPAFSAIKIDGKRAYDLARKGEEFEIKPRTIKVFELVLLHQKDAKSYDFTVTCSKGTYIRSLCRDIAAALGSLGHASALRRTQVGYFTEKDAISLDKLEEMVHSAPLQNVLRPVETVLDGIPVLALDPQSSERLRHGLTLRGSQHQHKEGETLIAKLDGLPVALCKFEDGQVRPVRVFNL